MLSLKTGTSVIYCFFFKCLFRSFLVVDIVTILIKSNIFNQNITNILQTLQFQEFSADMNLWESSRSLKMTFSTAQGHVFAMEISSGDEFHIACDNTGTPLAVFSNNGLLLKQVRVCFLVSSWACNLFLCLHIRLKLRVGVCRCSTQHTEKFTSTPTQTSFWWLVSMEVCTILWHDCCILETEITTSLQGGKPSATDLLFFSPSTDYTDTCCELSASHMFFLLYVNADGPLLTSALGHVLGRSLSPLTCTCLEEITPLAKSIRSKSMSQVPRKWTLFLLSLVNVLNCEDSCSSMKVCARILLYFWSVGDFLEETSQ